MPQTLSEEWKEELGANWSETHEKYLHTIGNLTLTGYNSELSNHSFKEKQDFPGGFRDSPLYLNKSLRGPGAMGRNCYHRPGRDTLGKGTRNLA